MPVKPFKLEKPVKEEEYEIIPHQILSDLRDEIDAVKQRLSTPVGELEKELLASMAELKHSVDQINLLIKSAAEEVKKEEKTGAGVQLKRLNDKIDQVAKQNEQIASALLSVANMVQGALKKSEPAARPMPRPEPIRPMMPSGPMPSRPSAPMPSRPGPMPPPRPMSGQMSGPMPPPRPMSRPIPPPGPGGMEMPPPPPGMEPGAEFEKKKGLLGMLFKK